MGTPAKSNERKKKRSGEKREAATSSAQASPEAFVAPMRETVKPALQLELTEAELEEEIPQMLTANNPAAPQNVTRFHAKERIFKLEAMVEQCAMHFSTDGWLLAKGSEDGKKQIETERLQQEALAKVTAEASKSGSHAGEPTDDGQQLRNQFNFSDRACQTTQHAPKDRGCYTEPPRTTTRSGDTPSAGSAREAFSSGSCSQWEIYDAYVCDIERQKLQEELSKKRSTTTRKSRGQEATTKQETGDAEATPEQEGGISARAARVLERMTMQNVFDEFSTDLKYWDDGADAFRPAEASLLPLWKFSDAASDGKQVTAICSNERYADVFAVGYGSFESLQQTTGYVSVYSIKNPAVPEKSIRLETGVLSVAFHPEFPNLLATGCYDGSVRVMDTDGKVLYVSDGATRRHTEPVWQVVWKGEAGVGALQLYSASADGTFGLWTFTQSEIVFEPMMSIAPTKEDADAASGMIALDFNKLEETTYLVGSEDGAIYRCSTEYDSEYLDIYCGHRLPIYAVEWNAFHPSVFLSASEDWTVRLWEAQTPRRAVMKFELNAPVTDVAWAPYSSTVFAAITASGYVFAFDIALNRHAAVCEQKLVNKGRLSKIVFQPRQPMLFVGDTNGIVRSLKLSPNLRKNVLSDFHDRVALENERQRLENVLTVARKSVVA